MKIMYAGAIVLSGLFSAAAMANQDVTNTQPQGTHTQEQMHGDSHVHENNKDGDKQKMKEHVQEDWREDAEKRRESDAMKPEQR